MIYKAYTGAVFSVIILSFVYRADFAAHYTLEMSIPAVIEFQKGY